MLGTVRANGDRLLGAVAVGAAAAILPAALLGGPLERRVGPDGRLALVAACMLVALVVTLLVPVVHRRLAR